MNGRAKTHDFRYADAPSLDSLRRGSPRPAAEKGDFRNFQNVTDVTTASVLARSETDCKSNYVWKWQYSTTWWKVTDDGTTASVLARSETDCNSKYASQWQYSMTWWKVTDVTTASVLARSETDCKANYAWQWQYSTTWWKVTDVTTASLLARSETDCKSNYAWKWQYSTTCCKVTDVTTASVLARTETDCKSNYAWKWHYSTTCWKVTDVTTASLLARSETASPITPCSGIIARHVGRLRTSLLLLYWHAPRLQVQLRLAVAVLHDMLRVIGEGEEGASAPRRRKECNNDGSTMAPSCPQRSTMRLPQAAGTAPSWPVGRGSGNVSSRHYYALFSSRSSPISSDLWGDFFKDPIVGVISVTGRVTKDTWPTTGVLLAILSLYHSSLLLSLTAIVDGKG
ncbi:hypothetical protein J6590_056735 [Homalodisca vitripennis]|nr:hypothetical protein J6590_056735 [Homalodisca vitripennis]